MHSTNVILGAALRYKYTRIPRTEYRIPINHKHVVAKVLLNNNNKQA